MNEKPFITRPTEFKDLLGYLAVYAGDIPAEDKWDDAEVFGEAFAAIELFLEHTPSDDGKELLTQVQQNLFVSYEYLEQGDPHTCSRTLQETDELFRKCRKYIRISDA